MKVEACDATNVLLAACGHDLRKILAWLISFSTLICLGSDAYTSGVVLLSDELLKNHLKILVSIAQNEFFRFDDAS